MSVGSIASSLVSSLDSTTNSTFSKMQQAWKDLENSLKSGDLNSAKKAYATITQLQQQMTSQFGNPPGGSQVSSDLEALGEALGSGNLSDAQQAFATLKNDMKNHPRPPMQNSDSSSSTDSEIIQLLQQLESSSSGSSASSTTSNSSLGQGISIKV